MIDKVQISQEDLHYLHKKGANLDPSEFDLTNIANSGLHSGEVSDQSVSEPLDYDLEHISESGRHISDILEA